MAYRRITPGSTSVSIVLLILKDDGTANTSLVYNSANLAVSYRRDNGTLTAITLATLASATASYSSGGFIHIGSGRFRLDLPDAAIASGASMVEIIVTDATDIRGESYKIQLDAIATITSGVVTANATQLAGQTVATTGSGSITFVRGQSVATANLFPTGFSGLNLVGGEVGGTYDVVAQITSTVNANVLSYAAGKSPGEYSLALAADVPTAATIRDAILDRQTSAHTTAGTVGKAIADGATASGGAISFVTDSGLVTSTSPYDPDTGTFTIYTGAAYTGTGEGISPPAKTWSGDSLDGAAVTLYVKRQDLYEDNSDVSAWVALDTGTITQTDTTIAVAFNPDATATASLAWEGNAGQMTYRAHVVATATPKRVLWDFPLIVRRGEWA